MSSWNNISPRSGGLSGIVMWWGKRGAFASKMLDKFPNIVQPYRKGPIYSSVPEVHWTCKVFNKSVRTRNRSSAWNPHCQRSNFICWPTWRRRQYSWITRPGFWTISPERKSLEGLTSRVLKTFVHQPIMCLMSGCQQLSWWIGNRALEQESTIWSSVLLWLMSLLAVSMMDVDTHPVDKRRLEPFQQIPNNSENPRTAALYLMFSGCLWFSTIVLKAHVELFPPEKAREKWWVLHQQDSWF